LGVAYETNPQLDAARAGLRATDEGVALANSNFRPSIGSSGIFGYERVPPVIGSTQSFHPLSGELQVQVPIFNYANFAQFDKARSQVEMGRAQTVLTEETVLFDAVTAYMNVVRDEAIEKLRENNLALLAKQREATQEQMRLGELTRTDLAQSEARLAGAQADLTSARGQLAISRSNFEHVIGRPAEMLEGDPALPALPNGEQAAINQALKFNPGAVAARYNVRVADAAVKQAIGALLPQVTVNGTYEYSRNNPTYLTPTVHAVSVEANVSIPIYQGGEESAMIRQTKELRAQAQLSVYDTERQIMDDTRTAWEGYKAAAAMIVSDQTAVDANKIAYEGVKLEEKVGSRTIIEVLNAEQELINSQVALVASKHDTTVAAYQLSAAMGRLTARGLALHVKIYDAYAHYDDDAGRWFGFGE
jgi:TolC family type I secretion outer membrane protein